MKKFSLLALCLLFSVISISYTQAQTTCPAGFGVSTSQGIASIDVEEGQNLTITSPTIGTSYQWYFDGTAIPNATQASYNITNAQSANAGAYTCDVDGEPLAMSLTVQVVEPLILQVQRDILMEFYVSTTATTPWVNANNWGSNLPLNDWEGITANDCGQVTGIKLNNNGLNGTIPASFANLTSLTSIVISQNSGLSGNIDVSKMSNLNTINIGGTQLSSLVLSNTVNANLSNIVANGAPLTGTIDISTMSNLAFLELNGCALDAVIINPNMTYSLLSRFIVAGTSSNSILSNSTTIDISNMPELKIFVVQHSDINTIIVNTTTTYNKLETFSSRNNNNLNGVLNLSQMPNLKNISVSNCNYSSIDGGGNSFDNLTIAIRVDNNNFTFEDFEEIPRIAQHIANPTMYPLSANGPFIISPQAKLDIEEIRPVTIGATTTLEVTLDGPTGITYQWYKDDVALQGPTADERVLNINSFSSADAGVYHCVMTHPDYNYNSFELTRNDITLTVDGSGNRVNNTGLDATTSDANVEGVVYPNPATVGHVINFQTSIKTDQEVNVQVYHASTAALVKSITIETRKGDTNIQFSSDQLKAGLYVIKYQIDGVMTSKKVMIK